jgi:misacylated tRNA(Ala) deacylase
LPGDKGQDHPDQGQPAPSPGIEQIRTIEIVGLDLQADGGTHVANTREVGGIRVTGYESKGRINKRIRLELTAPA